MDITKGFNPNGQPFSTAQPLKRVDEFKYLDSIEECQRYADSRSYSAFYPVKILPGMSQSKDKQWPIVMPAGTIVSVVDLKQTAEYTANEPSTGILSGGKVVVGISEIDGTPQMLAVDHFYAAENARGLIVPANGGVNTNDNYSDEDGENGVVLADGSVASSASTAYARLANVPVGIVPAAVYADLRHRYLNYEVKAQGTAIQMDGFLNLPYVQVYGAAGDVTAAIAAIRSVVDSRHQYLMSSGATVAAATLSLRTDLMPNSKGKFVPWDSASEAQKFGKFMGTDNRQVIMGLDNVIESFPGSNVKGTDTAGLSKRMYHFISSILSHPSVAPVGYAKNKANIVKALSTGYVTLTGATVKFNLANVIFGGASE